MLSSEWIAVRLLASDDDPRVRQFERQYRFSFQLRAVAPDGALAGLMSASPDAPSSVETIVEFMRASERADAEDRKSIAKLEPLVAKRHFDEKDFERLYALYFERCQYGACQKLLRRVLDRKSGSKDLDSYLQLGIGQLAQSDEPGLRKTTATVLDLIKGTPSEGTWRLFLASPFDACHWWIGGRWPEIRPWTIYSHDRMRSLNALYAMAGALPQVLPLLSKPGQRLWVLALLMAESSRAISHAPPGADVDAIRTLQSSLVKAARPLLANRTLRDEGRGQWFRALGTPAVPSASLVEQLELAAKRSRRHGSDLILVSSLMRAHPDVLTRERLVPVEQILKRLSIADAEEARVRTYPIELARLGKLRQNIAADGEPEWAIGLADEQRTAAEALGVAAAFENDLGIRFILVPPREGRPAIYMATHELQSAPFLAFDLMERGKNARVVEPDAVSHPLIDITHREARAFAMWLTRRGDGHTYRLPTESEWAHACAAGATTRFHFGDHVMSSDANFDTRRTWGPYAKYSLGAPALDSVGQFKPNGWGLYDMHGNAAEWCLRAHARPDPFLPDGYYPVRGGSFRSHPQDLTTDARSRETMDMGRRSVGVRLVIELPTPPK